MPLLGLSERTIRTPLRKGVRLSDSLSGFGMTQNPVKKGKMERTENAPPPPAGTTLERIVKLANDVKANRDARTPARRIALAAAATHPIRLISEMTADYFSAISQGIPGSLRLSVCPAGAAICGI